MTTGAEVPAGEEFLHVMGSAVTRAVFMMVPQEGANTVVVNKSPKVEAGKGPRMGGREQFRHTACRAGLVESRQAGNNAGSGNEDSGVSRLMGVVAGPAAEDSGVSKRSETDAVIMSKASWKDSGVSKQSEIFALIMSGASGAGRGAESEKLWYCPVDVQRGFEQVILSSAVQDGSEALSGDFTREGSIHGDEAGHAEQLDWVSPSRAARKHRRQDKCNNLGGVGRGGRSVLVGVQEICKEGRSQKDREELGDDRDGDVSGGVWVRGRDPARRQVRGDQGDGAAQVHDHGGPPTVGARLHTTGGVKSV
jgi:hypothetical protein